MRARGNTAGFTLLEVLVVTALTLMIAGVAAGGLRVAATGWAATGAAAERAVEREALRRFLRALIEGVAPPRIRDGTRTPPAVFFGEPDGFTTVARLPAALAPATPQLVSLRAREGGLELRWSPLDARRPDPTLSAPAGVERLEDGPVAVRFAYGPAAAARWTGRATAPALVSVSLDWGDSQMRVVAAPRAAGTP